MKHLSFEATAVQEMRNAQPPPPPPPFFVLLLLSATQLPSYVAFAYLFPCWTAWMAVINRARIVGIRGIKLATCCCLRIRISSTYTRRKKISDRPANPICNPALALLFLPRLVGHLAFSLFVVDLCLRV